MKRCVAFILAVMTIVSSCVMAAPLQKKKETVYVNLDEYGKVSKVNIYSKWLTNEAKQLVDNTKYITLENLTNREKYNKSGDTFIWNSSGEKYFTYTGEVGEEYYDMIPWTFDISYKVNGVEVTANELLGAKGLIKITIDIKSNKKANTYYRNNYMLEITGTYDMSEYLSVESEDAMITDTGNKKTLMFVVLPGQSTTINLEIGSNDFSMDGITMALVPITGDVKDHILELVEDRDDIRTAIDSINASADVVLNAMSGMTVGINGMSTGVNEIKQGTQNLHGINELRDEDIENLKTVLNELIPLLNDAQSDIDNLNKNYDIIVAFDEELNNQVKELNSNVNELNKNLNEFNKSIENLPNDVVEINSLIEATEDVVTSTGNLVKKLSGSSDESTDSLVKDLTSIATETESIGAIVQKTLPTVSDEATAGALLKIGSSAGNIGSNLKSVQSTLNEMSNSTLSGTQTLQRKLNKLADELHDVSKILKKDDAQNIVDLMKSLQDASTTLEKMLQTITKYNDDLLKNKSDFKLMTSTIKQLVDELSKMNTLSISMVTNAQSMLNAVDNDIYNGSNNTIDSLTKINNQLARMTSESSKIKKSKDDIKNIIDDKRDEIEEKTTIFNMDKDAKTVSFGSEKNENVDSVQFILKTPDIKKIKINNEDLESNKETRGFWEKVVFIFQKIFDWIKGIFN